MISGSISSCNQKLLDPRGQRSYNPLVLCTVQGIEGTLGVC